MVGIALEQHADRTRLFMQWKQMDWPVMNDPFNLLNLPVVPLTILLDEHGVVRLLQPLMDKLPEIEERVINADFAPPQTPADTAQTIIPDPDTLRQKAEAGDGTDWLNYAVALTLWGGDPQLDNALYAAQQAVNRIGDDTSHFYLGVIYRRRFDSAYSQPGDFENAVKHWGKALEINPNNYIWRRRLQQYGPRLDKPYSFYDWVNEARETITGRGEMPIPLIVEPGGAEFAYPSQDFSDSDGQSASDPDPDDKITHDDDAVFVKVETAVIPPRIVPGDSARVHVILRPNLAQKAHWNNEADDTTLWINPPDGWAVDEQYLTVSIPTTDVSEETRRFEFEVRLPEDAAPGEAIIHTYALYYVCEDVNGVCLFRRRDIPIKLEVLTAEGQRLKDGT